MNRAILASLCLSMIVSSLACAQLEDFTSGMEGIDDVLNALGVAYPTEEFEVEINSYFTDDGSIDVLNVYVINSEFGDLQGVEQEAQAREIASVVKDSHPGSADIETIVVIFREHSEAGALSFDSDEVYEFETSQLDGAVSK